MIIKRRQKKLLSLVLVAAVAVGLYTVAPMTTLGAQPAIKIYVDGKELEMDVPPIIYDDRTLVPIRAISEALNCKVQWIPEDRSVLIYEPSGSNLFMEMHIGQSNVTIYHHTYSGGSAPVTRTENAAMDVWPMIIEGRTLVPIRFISEWMGFTVEWKDEERAVMIISDAGNAILEEKLAGLWLTPYTTTGVGEFYALYPDGTFINGVETLDCAVRELFRTGSWSIKSGHLLLSIKTRVMAENGEIENIGGARRLIGADYVVRSVTPPDEEYFLIEIYGTDQDTARDMIAINYTIFYNYDESKDLVSVYDSLMSRLG